MGLFDTFKKRPKINVTFSVHDPTPEELENQRQSELHERVEEIRKFRRDSIPSKNGLLPHEILMLSYAHNYTTDKTDFPQFWYYDYAVDNPQKLLNSLLKRGFIREATAKESLSQLKVQELKAILLDLGLKATGKKENLIQIIGHEASEEYLSNKVPTRRYVLTELGDLELKENEYVSYLHKPKYGVDVWQMNHLLANYPHRLYRDKIWEELNRQTQEAMAYLSRGDYNSYLQKYVTNRYLMADFLVEEGRYSNAFPLQAEGLYYKINFQEERAYRLWINYKHDDSDQIKKRVRDKNTGKSVLVTTDELDTFEEHAKLYPYDLNSLLTIVKELSWDKDMLYTELIDEFSHIEFDVPLFSPEETAALITAELFEMHEIASKIYSIGEKRIKKSIAKKR